MTEGSGSDADLGMLELFKTELEAQAMAMGSGLLSLERMEGSDDVLKELMRAAHSIKGAARIVHLETIVHLAHAMEDIFSGAQKNTINLTPNLIDLLLLATDLFASLTKVPLVALSNWLEQKRPDWERVLGDIQKAVENKTESEGSLIKRESPEVKVHLENVESQNRALRVSAYHLNRLMGLVGESLIETHSLEPFYQGFMRLKRMLDKNKGEIERLRVMLSAHSLDLHEKHLLEEAYQNQGEACQFAIKKLGDLELYITKHTSLSDRLYREVLDTRMRPFADGIEGFPRMVRDMAKELNKKVKFVVRGKNTPVDREILEKLETPLSHLIRNAIDHGIETPSERLQFNKSEEGTITLEAEHRAGILAVTLSDDGRGVDLEKLRKKLVESRLITEEIAGSLSETELLDFLMLPGFSTSTQVTEISGRGVGLNIVQNMVNEVGGSLHIVQQFGKGMSFHLQLPLTLSVLRALLVEIGNEPFAVPLTRISNVILVDSHSLQTTEGRPYFYFEGTNIGLVPASQIMELEEVQSQSSLLPIVIIKDRESAYGLIVDKFVGQTDLVVHELDPRLGKVPDINAGAIMEDGSPILIMDVDDLVRSIDQFLRGGRLRRLKTDDQSTKEQGKKHILVVDDSVTVREVECRLLRNHGFEVETAVNGMDGWNAVRTGSYDLVITDVDMPRMNGIELVRAIRADPKLSHLPVMIVSYKEREEDRLLGLQTGANYYFTKGGFNDESLIQAVIDLIGNPTVE